MPTVVIEVVKRSGLPKSGTREDGTVWAAYPYKVKDVSKLNKEQKEMLEKHLYNAKTDTSYYRERPDKSVRVALFDDFGPKALMQLSDRVNDDGEITGVEMEVISDLSDTVQTLAEADVLSKRFDGVAEGINAGVKEVIKTKVFGKSVAIAKTEVKNFDESDDDAGDEGADLKKPEPKAKTTAKK